MNKTLYLLQNPFLNKSQAKQLHAQILKTQTHFQTYKSIIKCYTSSGLFSQTLSSFVEMWGSGYYPDHNVVPSVLKSCTHLRDLRFGESVHGSVVQFGLDSDLFTCNALMNMYAKLQCRSSFLDCRVFDESPQLRKIDEFSKFCGNDMNRNIVHMGLIKGLKRNSNTDSVRKVFETMPKRDIVSWNTVIAGYAQNGMYDEALEMVRELGRSDLCPDSFTLSSVLPIFAEYMDVLKGKEIHGYAIKHGFDDDVYIGSSLIDMYANCMRIEDSYRVFERLPQCDGVSWSSLIAGYVQNGMFDEGLKLFRGMISADIRPIPVSFSSIIPACAHLTSLNLGKQLHGYTIRCNFDDNVFIASSLVDFYARCGDIKIARYIFDKIQRRDIVSYTAMIMGCALHGHSHDAISLFDEMEMEKVKPNAVVFIAVLTACSHGRLVDEGWAYFKRMKNDYGISWSFEHYAAMADLLGRAGKLEEAYDFISNIDSPSLGSVWLTLLSACKVKKNIELAKRVAEKIFSLDPHNEGAYALLSNTYSAAKLWKDSATVLVAMRDKGIRKNVGCSWIEIESKVHAFVAGDKSHPSYIKIYEILEVLLQLMEKKGYVSGYE